MTLTDIGLSFIGRRTDTARIAHIVLYISVVEQ